MNESKSGDSSLRDWFGKSRSSDGKPGWVQLGGKYAGKPCAKQPGQTTKPKCGSSKMKRNLDKDEEQAAFRRKQRQDPNPDRKGKAINVKTESYVAGKPAEKLDAVTAIPKKEQDAARERLLAKAKAKREAMKTESYVAGKPAEKLDAVTAIPKKEQDAARERLLAKAKAKREAMKEGKGEKDACYHKVKSRYSVWPSAYASGALVKCRKVGAANWGNKTKKEEFEPKEGLTFQQFQEKCWKGYEKKGMKTMFGKRYPNCVKKESYEIDTKKHRAAQRDAKIGNLARNTSNPGEKAAAEKKSKGPKMFGEDWQKVNKSDKTDGMSLKAVKAYRRENPGSKLKTAVTGNPKKGSKDSKRRSSYCSRSEGQKKMHNIDCTKTPDKAICKARRRWKC